MERVIHCVECSRHEHVLESEDEREVMEALEWKHDDARGWMCPKCMKTYLGRLVGRLTERPQ